MFLEDGDKFDPTTTFPVPEYYFLPLPEIPNPWVAGYPAENRDQPDGSKALTKSPWELAGYYQVGQKGFKSVKMRNTQIKGHQTLLYGMQTNRGQSGSPLFLVKDDGEPMIFGIHNTGGPDGGLNKGVSVNIHS